MTPARVVLVVGLLVIGAGLLLLVTPGPGVLVIVIGAAMALAGGLASR